MRTLTKKILLGAGVIGVAGACGDVPVDSTNFPAQGNLKGTVTYTGPMPCTQRVHDPTTGEDRVHVVGAALMLVFNENLLPPPEGFGTSAAQLGVVPGDVLFQSIAAQLPVPGPTTPTADQTHDPSSSVVCPPPGTNVTVSGDWKIGPLPAGRYQVRGFYDYEGTFSPVNKIHQLPTQGDIGGGALANAEEVLAGKPAKFATFQLGADLDGTGRIAIDSRTGASVEGIAVSLAQKLTYSRPIFTYSDVLDKRPPTVTEGPPGTPGACAGSMCAAGFTCSDDPVMGTMPPTHTCSRTTVVPNGANPVTQTDPNNVTLSRDERFLFGVSDPKNLNLKPEEHFLRVRMHAGLPEAEQPIGTVGPYFLQAAPPQNKLWIYADTDAAGAIKGIPESPKGLTVASLFPQAIFGKLDDRDPRNQTAQASPAVIIQGINLTDGLTANTVTGCGGLNSCCSAIADAASKDTCAMASKAAQGNDAQCTTALTQLRATPAPNGCPPTGKFTSLLGGAALKTPRAADYIDVALRPSVICLNPLDPLATVYVVTPEFEAFNGDVLISAEDLAAKVVAQLGNRPNVKVVKGCLPTGSFQGNLVYPTGQAWTLPNEAGNCMPLELPGANGTCTQAGNTRTLLPSQSIVVHVAGERQPGYCSTKSDPSAPELHYYDGVPDVCLRPDEIAALKK
jgi:hypothetical protein